MRKIYEMVESFGGSFVNAYEELVDMGEVRESDSLRQRCERLDRKVGNGFCDA